MKIRIFLAIFALVSGIAQAQQPIPIQSLPVATIPLNQGDLFIVGQNNVLRKVTLAQLNNAIIPLGPAGGDLSGTYPNPTVIAAHTPTITGLATFTGQVVVNNNTVPQVTIQAPSVGAELLIQNTISGRGSHILFKDATTQTWLVGQRATNDDYEILDLATSLRAMDINKLTGDVTLGEAGTLTLLATGSSAFVGNVTISAGATPGNLTVAGTTTLQGTLGVTGAATLSGTLGVTGAAILQSTLNVTGATTVGKTSVTDTTQAGLTDASLVTSGGTLVKKNLISGGHIGSTGLAPSPSACGFGAFVNGTDNSMKVNVGSGSTGCVVTFATAFTTSNVCVPSSEANKRFTYAYNHSAITITNVDDTSGTAIDILCTGF